MLTFKNITVRDAAMLRRYYENCDYALCEYSAGVKLMWRSALRYAWAEAAGCLIIRCESEGRVSFDYPVAGPDGDEDAALSAIEAYCMETGIQPEISIVPEEKAPVLLSRYPYVRVSNIRTWRDYLYYKEDLQLFAGRRYSGQRNHIKKFYAQWPNAEFRPISAKADAEAIEQFWVDFKVEFPKDSGSKAMAELELSKKMMAMPDKPWLLRGGMFDGEKLIALSLCEKCGETLIIHIEKADIAYEGIYQVLVNEYAKCFVTPDVRYINREEDVGDEGMRRSKESYHPVRLLEKYLVRIPVQPEKGETIMQEVYEFLKKCGTYYLATVDGDQPHVRPFGTVNLFEGKLYIQTGKVKAVSKEMAANPKVELCAFDGETWLRVSATAVEDDRVAARQDMLDHYPELQSMYAADDGNTQVLALTDATATFSSFAAAPRTVRW